MVGSINRAVSSIRPPNRDGRGSFLHRSALALYVGVDHTADPNAIHGDAHRSVTAFLVPIATYPRNHVVQNL